MDKCLGEHTLYQPTYKEWRCPECGGGDECFYIDSASLNHPNCRLLHVDDVVICASDECTNEDGGCHTWSGKEIAVIMQKKADMVKCPYCKGSGFVMPEPALPFTKVVKGD